METKVQQAMQNNNNQQEIYSIILEILYISIDPNKNKYAERIIDRIFWLEPRKENAAIGTKIEYKVSVIRDIPRDWLNTKYAYNKELETRT